MQCIIMCSKTNKIYTHYMHFLGVFMPPKTFASGAVPQTGPFIVCKSISMAVLVFQVYFHTVLVIEKNEI